MARQSSPFGEAFTCPYADNGAVATQKRSRLPIQAASAGVISS